MTITTLTIIWAGLFVALVFIALARTWTARREDDTLHLHEFETGVIREQTSLAHRLRWLDTFGKTMTVVVLLYGLALLGRFIYAAWLEGQAVHMQ